MTSCAKYLTNPRDFDGGGKGKCLGWFDCGCRHPDDGVGCPIFGGGSNQIELSSVGRVSGSALTGRHARGSLFDSRTGGDSLLIGRGGGGGGGWGGVACRLVLARGWLG